MIVLVCGGRDFSNKTGLEKFLDAFHKENRITQLIHGDARGADRLAKQWAISRGVPQLPFPADWSKGNSAGPIRNRKMLAEGKPEMIIAFPGGRGTQNMTDQAMKAGVRIVAPNPVDE